MFTKADEIKNTWEEYNIKKSEEYSQDQTSLFFNTISSHEKDQFKSSRNQVLQLGVSTGNYISALSILCPERRLIGYDYSENALKELDKKRIEGRLVNLNDVNSSEKQLDYYNLLAKDLSVSTDILIIRTLEYLNPAAVTLLLLALIDLAKPGSRFYIEIFSFCNDDYHAPNNNIIFHHKLRTGYVPSFFSARTDMEFISHEAEYNPDPGNPRDKKEGTITERFIVQKHYL